MVARGAALAAFFFCAAFVQASEEETLTPIPDGAAPEAEDGLSELDRLSRSADDPFAGVIEEERREPVSVTVRALDKITARYTDIEIAMHEIARFGSLELQPRTCDKRPPEEFPETTVFLEIYDTEYGDEASNLKIDPALLNRPEPDDAEAAATDELEVRDIQPFPSAAGEDESADAEAARDPFADGEARVFRPAQPMTPAPEVMNGPQAEGENIFRGWMFASSPALNALEHPVYDVWVIDCKTKPAES